MTWIPGQDEAPPPLSGSTDVARQLVEQAPPGVDVLKLAVSDALEAAGMTEDDRYYIRVSVIELPDGCENWPWEGASREVVE